MITINNGKLILSGRVDSANAAQLEQELFAAWQDGDAIIDAEKLEYISSAGLRVLLKLRKKSPNVVLQNVSPEVYDIFEVTGFTEMLTVKKALRFVSIKNAQLLGQGGHGKVYKLSEDMIIKTYHDSSTLAEIERERQYGKTAFVKGLPCAIAFDVVKCEEGYGVIFEMAGALTLSKYIMEQPEQLEVCAVKYAQLLKTLHSIEADTSLYTGTKDIWARYIDNNQLITEEERALLKKLLDAIPNKTTMVHGDYHPGNIMVNQDGELLLIDMAEISYGDPIFDIGGTYMALVQLGKTNPDRVKSMIGLDAESAAKMWEIMLPIYYGTNDPETLKLLNERCRAFSLFRLPVIIGGIPNPNSEQAIRNLIVPARKFLFPNIERFCTLFSMEV